MGHASPSRQSAPPSVRQAQAPDTPLPHFELSPEDADRYRLVFRLQEQADWAEADAVIAEIEDDRLMGHVLYQRLMHPTGYRSSYAELRDWLERYGDHPGAEKVYRLALRRMEPGAPQPRHPADPGARVVAGPFGREGLERPMQVAPRRQEDDRSEAGRAAARRLAETLAEAIDASAWNEVRAALDEAQGIAPLDLNAIRMQVAADLFFDGKARPAYELARSAAEQAGDDLPRSHWIAGLAAWRLGQPARAARHFEALARSDAIDSWDKAAGAFWAARAYGKLRNAPERSRWLDRAAQHPRSFYGLLANRVLGREPDFEFKVPALTPRHVKALAEHPAAIRAVALLQVGQHERAEQELRRLDPDDKLIAQALVAVADQAGLPALALHLGSLVRHPEGALYDAALYPLPPWQPHDGFQVDRALLFALMRQESRFSPSARSGNGAAGLMQLMPSTARSFGDGQDFRGDDRHALFEPELNLTLGQRYIAHLLKQKSVGRNLLKLLAAYNAGPGNLQRWRSKLGKIDDPLLFLESLPSAETRGFVSLVLTNYWIYRKRLDQPTPSLDAIAEDRWPVYIPGDLPDTLVAFDAEN